MEALTRPYGKDFTDEEREFFDSEYKLKQFILFCNLGMDTKVINGECDQICYGLKLSFVE